MNLFGAAIIGSIIGVILGILLSPLAGIGFLIGWAIGGFIAGILAKGAGRGFLAGFLMCIIGPIFVFFIFMILGIGAGIFADIPYLGGIIAGLGGVLAIALFITLFITSLCCSAPAGLIGGAVVGKEERKSEQPKRFEEEKIACLKCGRLYPIKYNICPYCGASLKDVKEEGIKQQEEESSAFDSGEISEDKEDDVSNEE